MKEIMTKRRGVLSAAILAWVLVISLTTVALAEIDATWSDIKVDGATFTLTAQGTQNASTISRTSMSGGTITLSATGYTTTGACNSTNHNADTVTFTLTNTTVQQDGLNTHRGVRFSVKVNGATVGDYNDTVAEFTAQTGEGSSAATITIEITVLDMEDSNVPLNTTIKKASGGVVKINGTALTDAEKTHTAEAGTTYTLAAVPDDDYEFYGWRTNSRMLSLENPFEYTPNSDTTVSPVFVKSGSAMYAVNDVMYGHLDEAITAANGNGTIIVKSSGTVYHSNGTTKTFTLPAGVKLLVPYSATDTGLFKGIETSDSAYVFADIDGITYNRNGNLLNNTYAPVSYVTLTVPSGVTITCESGSAISLSGTKLLHGNQAYGNGQTIAYNGNKVGYIKLDGKIVLEGGSDLYCYGYIIGDGTVEAEGGAAVHENLELNDYKGGTAAAYYATPSTYNTFPYNQYYAQNVEANLLLEKGASNIVYMGVYADNGAIISNAQLVGDSGLFRWSSASISVLREYEAKDRVRYTINGDVSFSGLSLDVKQATVDSRDFVMPLNSNMTVILQSGTLTITEDVALLPDTKVVVGQEATITIDPSAKCYIYDKTDWRGFAYASLSVFGRDCSPTRDGYTPDSATFPGSKRRYGAVSASASLEINGTMNMYGNVFTTRGGVGPIKVGANAENTRTVYEDPRSMDKVIKGTGTINSYPATTSGDTWGWRTDQAMSQVTMTRMNNKTLALYVVFCDPAFAHIAGVDDGTTYSTFKTGTSDSPVVYHGVVVDGVNYWKQNELTVVDPANAITVATGSLNAGIGSGLSYVSDLSVASGAKVLTNNASGRAVSEKHLTFTLAEGYTYNVTVVGAELTEADGVYTLANVTDDVLITVERFCAHVWGEQGICTECGKRAAAYTNVEVEVEGEKTLQKQYFDTVQNAVASSADNVIVMNADTAEPGFALDEDIVLDLTGYDLTLATAMSGSGKISAIDSSTNGYNETGCGTLVGLSGESACTPNIGANAGKHYLKVTNKDGSISFHRVAVHVTGIQFALEVNKDAEEGETQYGYLTFRGTFRGNAKTAGKLSDVGFMFNNDETDSVWFGEENTGKLTHADQTHFYYTKKLASINDITHAAALMQFVDAGEPCVGASVNVNTLLQGLKGGSAADWTQEEKAAFADYLDDLTPVTPEEEG